MLDDPYEPILRAAEALARANALIVAAGAGMGVDSGLPDFRGREGFWRAYPPFAKLGLDFRGLANPRWFQSDPALAWGFYGHRRNLYRETEPHDGFAILRRWGERQPLGSFVITSNVDGHFQRAGFDPDRIVEVHGALEWMQCLVGCGAGVYAAEADEIDVDPRTFRAEGSLPRCPNCGALARPNVLMFGDWDWDSSRTEAQHARLRSWLHGLATSRTVIVECGAGTAVPTIRLACEDLAERFDATMIRINPHEPEVPEGQISIAARADEALAAIDEILGGLTTSCK